MGRNLYIQKGAEEMTLYRVQSGKVYYKDGLINYLKRYLPRMLFVFFYDTKKNIKYRAFELCSGGYRIDRWDDKDEKWITTNDY